jgi:hypothetical protein
VPGVQARRLEEVVAREPQLGQRKEGVMSRIAFEHDYELVTCGADGCDQTFGMHEDYYKETRRTGETWYCPKGHPRVWGGADHRAEAEETPRRARSRSRTSCQAAVAEGEQTRQALLRDRQRFANGVCPCCNRSFENVRRHMTTKHPDYDAQAAVDHRQVQVLVRQGSSRPSAVCAPIRGTSGPMTGRRGPEEGLLESATRRT